MERMTVVYPVRLTPSQMRRIKAKAQADGRPVANYIRRVLDLATRDVFERSQGKQRGVA